MIVPGDSGEMAGIRKKVLSEPTYINSLISADGQSAAIILEMEKYPEDGDTLDPKNEIAPVIRKILNRPEFAALNARVAGSPIMHHDYDEIAGREAIVLKRKTHGLTFEISDKFLDDDLNAGFRGTYFTSHEGSACEIFAEYKVGDNWTIAPGYMSFNGPKDSRLGQFDDNDMIYLRLRYSF